MASLFTKIINHELPGRFVWADAKCVAFLTINPLNPGHTLVVPREEVDHWLDLSPELAAHLNEVARLVGRGIQAAFSPTKVGLIIAGLEVNHVHLHLVPINSLGDLNFANADSAPNDSDMDKAAESLRATLRAQGHSDVCD
ncbi:MAG: histidine triad (HIT) family protein [Pseudohongiellaceae bacterium]|jgi:histidine triad (HIT) family protein